MTRVKKLGLWLLVLPLSAGMLRGGKFPTDSHPPTLEEAHELLPAVCVSGVMAKTGKHGVDSGCRLCPGIVPGGGAFNSNDPSEASLTLYGVINGSFTRAGNQEVVADFFGCEPHADNFGGSVLLEKTSQGWKVKSYQAGFISSDCLKYRTPNGRDILVCRGGYSGQGETDSTIFISDYSLPPQQKSKTLLSTTDTLGTCLSGEQLLGSIDDVALRDLNHDGMPDIAVTVKAAKINVPAGHEQDCEAHTKFAGVKPQEVDFLFANGTFKLAPWSERTKQALETLFGQ